MTVEPFALRVSDAEIDDLRARLTSARLPETETVAGAPPGRTRWDQGVPLAELKDLIRYWADDHDWRSAEAALTSAGQCRITIQGLGIHVLHRRSARPDATPLLITHGWPGSIFEFTDILDELVDPTDSTAPAFHVVAPSLPGFGFSDKPTSIGWGIERIADAWAEIMTVLGYARFLAHGGDWGAVVATVLAGDHHDRVLAMHTTFPQAPPNLPTRDLTKNEVTLIEETKEFWRHRAAYAQLQATRPQTIGYSLVDSPVGLLAWMLDKFAEWSDTEHSPFETISRDRFLDNVSWHWFGRSGASSARIYWESYGKLRPSLIVTVPTAISVFPYEIEKFPRRWLEHRYLDITYWNELERGGHFPSLEVPHVLVAELRSAFAPFRLSR